MHFLIHPLVWINDERMAVHCLESGCTTQYIPPLGSVRIQYLSRLGGARIQSHSYRWDFLIHSLVFCTILKDNAYLWMIKHLKTTSTAALTQSFVQTFQMVLSRLADHQQDPNRLYGCYEGEISHKIRLPHAGGWEVRLPQYAGVGLSPVECIRDCIPNNANISTVWWPLVMNSEHWTTSRLPSRSKRTQNLVIQCSADSNCCHDGWSLNNNQFLDPKLFPRGNDLSKLRHVGIFSLI